MKREPNLLSLLFNKLEYKNFISVKHFYDFSKSIYNNPELDRKSGEKYITHINDILEYSLNKYNLTDIQTTKIIIGHDIFEENETLYFKTNGKKGFKTNELKKQLSNYLTPYEIKGINCLTHDEDISKLAKVSKVIESGDLRLIIIKSLDILANSNDHPENLRFESKLNKIHQADLVIDYLTNLNNNHSNNNYKKYIKSNDLYELIFDLKKGRKKIFDLALDERIIFEDLNHNLFSK